jgi:hypothetical protein
MFTYVNLIRTLIVEAKSRPLEKNDGLDFCHAVIGSAFSSFASLDTKWKRRVELLPKNRLALIYGPQQLDQMVNDIERGLRSARRDDSLVFDLGARGSERAHRSAVLRSGDVGFEAGRTRGAVVIASLR